MKHSIGATVALLALCTTTPAAAIDPVPSWNYLTTGNGFGFQVFDTNQHRIREYLERPYRYVRPNPANPDGEGIVRRNLAYDVYFGLRAGTQGAWLADRSQEEIGYVEQTNIIRSATHVGSLRAESLFFAPFGYEGNGMVALVQVTNEGGSAVDADAFALTNFHMGSAPQPDYPGTDGERITYYRDGPMVTETGRGGGVMVYAPIGGADHSNCASDAYSAVSDGRDIGDQDSCEGQDRINVFQRSLGSIAPGASATWGVAILFASTAGDANPTFAAWQEFLAGRDGATLYTDALREWDEWRMAMPGGLTSAEERVWRQAEAVLRMGQIREVYSAALKNHGMILASLPPGGWHTGWVRDAMYAIVALARMGHHEEAKKALNFFLDADAGLFSSELGGVDYRISVVRYFGNGLEEADYSGQPTRNIEIDGWGMYMWAARTYLDASGDDAWLDETTRHGDTVYEAIREGVAEALAANVESSGIPIADASIWEVHWGNRQHFLYTAAATARGFCDMAAIARRFERDDDVAGYAGLAEAATQGLRAQFIDQNRVLAGSIEGLARGSNYHDGAVVEAFGWQLIPFDDPIATATLNAFSYLLTPAGGYKRVEGSNEQYDTDEWILIDLRASMAFRRLGQTDRADLLVDWVTGQASVNYDLIPELYNTRTTIGSYNGSIPMVGYGAGAYILTMLGRLGLHENADCGSEEPVDPDNDGGPVYPDAGSGGDEDGGTGPGPSTGRTGTACLCDAAGLDAPLSAAAPLALALALLALRRYGRS